jgi:hypothetical protein
MLLRINFSGSGKRENRIATKLIARVVNTTQMTNSSITRSAGKAQSNMMVQPKIARRIKNREYKIFIFL